MASSEDSLISRAEKLLSSHHHLLMSGIIVGCLPLVHQIKEVSLIGSLLSVTNTARGANPIVTHSSTITLVLLVITKSTIVSLGVLVNRGAIIVLGGEALVAMVSGVAGS